MKQQINLIDGYHSHAGLFKDKIFVLWGGFLILLIIVVFALKMYALYLQNDFKELDHQYQLANVMLKEMHQKMNSNLLVHNMQNDLDEINDRIEKDKKRLLKMRNIHFEKSRQFSEILSKIYSFNPQQLSITELVIDDFGKQIDLKGLTENYQDVPALMSFLNTQPVFQGKTFSRLSVTQKNNEQVYFELSGDVHE